MTRFEQQMTFKIGDKVKINDNPKEQEKISRILQDFGLSSIFIGRTGEIQEIRSFSRSLNCQTYRMTIGNAVWYVPHLVLQRI